MRFPWGLLLPLALLPFLLANLPSHSFWYDEAYTANLTTFRAGVGYLVRTVAEKDAHPPFFYLLAWVWAKATGLWGVAVEAPPQGIEPLARSLGVYLGLALTAPLAAFSPPAFLLLWSSDAWLAKVLEWRMYALLGGLWLLGLWALSRRSPWGLGLSALLGLYTHYLSLFYVGLLYLALPFLWPKEAYWGRKGLPLLLPLLFLPWMIVLIRSALEGRSNAFLRPDPVLALDPLYLLGGGGGVGYLVLFAHLLGIWGLLRSGERQKLLLSLLPLLAVLLWWASSQVVNTTSPRYFGAFLPPIALGWAWALEGLRSLLPAPATLGIRLFPWLLSLPLALRLLLPWGWLVPDENYLGKAARASAMEARYGPGVVVADEGGRLMTLLYYWRGQSRLLHVGGISLEDPPEAPWYGLLLFSRMMGTEAGERMAELARLLEGRGCALLSKEGGDPRLLLYACPTSPARAEGEGAILPAVAWGSTPMAMEVDR